MARLGGRWRRLWDEVLPVEARELPEDLQRINALLSDPALLAPVTAHWDAEAEASGRSQRRTVGPTIAMETYVT